MGHGVERDTAQQVGGIIALLEGDPRVCDLMHNNGEYEYDEYRESRRKLHGEKVPEVVSGG